MEYFKVLFICRWTGSYNSSNSKLLRCVSEMVKLLSVLCHFLFFLVILLLGPLAVFAEKETGDAVFKRLLINSDGKEFPVQEPLIIFEGQNFLPLKAVANFVQKSVTYDERQEHLIIGHSHQKIFEIPTLTQEEPKSPSSLTFVENVSSSGVLIMEDNENKIMFEKNGFSTFYPASTTKVLTALIALERGNLSDKITVSKSVNQLPSDSRRVFIQPGDVLTLEQLLYGMLLYSGNDCALAIAEHIAGSESAFAQLMNEKANEIGAKNSNFVNSHGYHHPDHYTTPYDLALILKAASKNEHFLKMINTSKFKAEYRNKNGKKIVRTWETTNSFLKDTNLFVDGIIGGKTGYTNPARRNLVTIAEHKGHRYFVVVLKGDAQGRYIDTRKLLLRAYKKRDEYEKKLIKNITVSFANHSLAIGDRLIPSTGKSFIYKGRTYVSQGLINQIFADIRLHSMDDQKIKMVLKPKFSLDQLSYLMTIQAKKQNRGKFLVNNEAIYTKMPLLSYTYFKTIRKS